jgi:hypothetical protein
MVRCPIVNALSVSHLVSNFWPNATFSLLLDLHIGMSRPMKIFAPANNAQKHAQIAHDLPYMVMSRPFNIMFLIRNACWKLKKGMYLKP